MQTFRRLRTTGNRTRRTSLGMVIALLLAAMLQLLLGSGANAQETPAAIPENVLQASVRIMTNIEVTPDDPDNEPFLCMIDEETVLDWSVGSGTIISEDGFVLTNHHVIATDRMPREVSRYCENQNPRGRAKADWVHTAWLPDARGIPTDAYRAEIVEDSSLRIDLAVVKLAKHADGSKVNTRRNPFPVVQFGDSDLLREPEKIFLVGYPANAGENRRVSEGIFSGWGDNGYGEQWIYTDATISGGNSGGTAVNSAGLFVGIPTQGTSDDCRPGDTNADGVIDENDSGCIGLGGNYGILIPSNIARAFAEEAIGQEIAIATGQTPVDPDETPIADETPDPSNADGPPVGEIGFTAYDLEGETLDTYANVNLIDGCFRNLTVVEGQEGTATWYLDDAEYLVTEFVWDDTWNPQACASIFIDKEEEVPYLDPGVYRLEVTTGGKTVVSEEITVTLSTNVESVTFSGRDVDRENVTATDDNILTGEIVTVTAKIAFSNMVEGSIWQVELMLDGDVVFGSEPESWGPEASGTESVRIRNAEREPLEPGTYELVLTIDGVVANRTPLVIEN